MKDGTRYAERLKKACAKLRKPATMAEFPEWSDPVRALAIGVLGTDFGEERAERLLNHALTTMVDWNEIRVSNALELSKTINDSSPGSMDRCRNLIDAIQAVYDRENVISLERLKSTGRREAKHYLETLKGVDEYAVATIVLWSLGGHAIPVSNRLLAALRKADLVNPTASRAEVQAFLERNVAASEAREFCMMMRSLGSSRQSSNRRSVTRKVKSKRKAAK